MDTQRVLEAATEVAREAGEILLGFVGGRLGIEHKGDVDLVTRADQASEKHIVSRIRSTFPEHDILAEEGGEAGAGSRVRWLVDPLDGTTNFAHGLPIWAVSIGVLEDGVPTVAVVHDPSRGETFTAARGGGARRNGERLSVSRPEGLGRALLVTGFPYDVRTSAVNNLDHFARFMKTSRSVRRLGSAALDLAYVASGRFDGFWELKLHPWDVAAGALLVTEAGGRVCGFAGEPFDPYGNEIVAGAPELVTEMLSVLAEGARPAPS